MPEPIVRARLLTLLEAGPVQTDTVARQLGISLNHARRELNDLRQIGITTARRGIKHTRRSGQPANLWSLTP